jgi:hypothetical protein
MRVLAKSKWEVCMPPNWKSLLACHFVQHTRETAWLLSLKRITPWPGLQENWTARIYLNLLAQAIHHILKQNLIAVPKSAPNRLNNILHGEKMSRTTHEQVKQSKFEIG